MFRRLAYISTAFEKFTSARLGFAIMWRMRFVPIVVGFDVPEQGSKLVPTGREAIAELLQSFFDLHTACCFSCLDTLQHVQQLECLAWDLAPARNP